MRVMRDLELQDECGDGLSESRLSGLRERTPGDIEAQVLQLTPQSSLDQLCAALDAADWLMARARTVHQLMKQIAINWIDQHGEFDIGDIHYSVGYCTTVKCADVSQVGHAVLIAAGGDFDQFLTVLTSQPYKHATVRNIIGKPLHDRLFRFQRVGRLKNGVPERVLKHVDKRFLSSTNG
jgi:hypothetical protein